MSKLIVGTGGQKKIKVILGSGYWVNRRDWRGGGAGREGLDLRTLRPLDTQAIIESVKRTGRLLIVHEAPRFGGFAGEIAAQICEEAFEWLDAPIRRVTALDTPIPFSPPLEEYYLPQTDDIVDAARWLLAY